MEQEREAGRLSRNCQEMRKTKKRKIDPMKGKRKEKTRSMIRVIVE